MSATSARPLDDLRAQWRSRWQTLAPRERIGLVLAATALGILLVWMAGIAPALRTLRTVPAQREELAAQYQLMQKQAAESRQWRGQPPVTPGQAESAVRAATEQLGAGARLNLTPERTTVTLENVDGAALAAWLVEVRTAARGRITEAQLTRTDKGYSGTLALSLPRP